MRGILADLVITEWEPELAMVATSALEKGFSEINQRTEVGAK